MSVYIYGGSLGRNLGLGICSIDNIIIICTELNHFEYIVVCLVFGSANYGDDKQECVSDSSFIHNRCIKILLLQNYGIIDRFPNKTSTLFTYLFASFLVSIA